MKDITDEFDDGSLEQWREGMCQMIRIINKLTEKKWIYFEAIYDGSGNVTGCKLYGNGSENVDAIRH